MLKEVKTKRHHYFVDEKHLIQGEYKAWDENGILRFHCIYANSELHGEYKMWNEDGQLASHSFYLKGRFCSFKKIPRPPVPTTPEDFLYYRLKYNITILPVEQSC